MFDELSELIPFTPTGFRTIGVNPPPSSATLHRWRLRGIKGVRIASIMRGGRRYTTSHAVREFINAVTTKVDGPSHRVAVSHASAVLIRSAEKELDDAGA